MFIDKHRHALAGFAKDLLHLIEEPALGIDGVAGGVFRIHAVLGNQQHAVHRQLARAQRERFFDGFVNGHLELLRPLAARVVLRHLIGVQRNQLKIRPLAFAIECVGEYQPAHNHIRMRVVPILGDNRRDALGRRGAGRG
ncbi:MAG: hypothetical protein CMI65_14900 [Pedosphaera sp.]|nr:hypothetical protein [Pedosphaera sp.]